MAEELPPIESLNDDLVNNTNGVNIFIFDTTKVPLKEMLAEERRFMQQHIQAPEPEPTQRIDRPHYRTLEKKNRKSR